LSQSSPAEVTLTNLPRLCLTSTISSHRSLAHHKVPESIVEDKNIDLNCKFIKNAFDHYSADLKFDFSDSAAEPDLQKIKRK